LSFLCSIIVILKISKINRPDEEKTDLGGLVDNVEVVLPVVIDRMTVLAGEFELIVAITSTN
jgi:hypothetical protein